MPVGAACAVIVAKNKLFQAGKSILGLSVRKMVDMQGPQHNGQDLAVRHHIVRAANGPQVRVSPVVAQQGQLVAPRSGAQGHHICRMPSGGKEGLVRGQVVVHMPLHAAHCRVELLQKIHKAQAAVQGGKFVGISKKPPHLFGVMLRVPAPHHLVEVGNLEVFVKILAVKRGSKHGSGFYGGGHCAVRAGIIHNKHV